MVEKRYLLAGLGNPGIQYEGTRHNVGFAFLDYFAEKHDLKFTASKWQAQICKMLVEHVQLFLLKPETFMNASGSAVARFVNYHKIAPGGIVVIHDDIDLPLGRVKIVARGSAAGHKGVQSIITMLGTNEFSRIKVGIGRPQTPIAVEQFVLSKMSHDEQVLIEDRFPLIEKSLQTLIKKGVLQAMNLMNRKK